MQEHTVTNTSRRRITSTTTLHPSQAYNNTISDQAVPNPSASSAQHGQTQTSQAPAPSTRRRAGRRRTPNISVRRVPHSLNSMEHFLHHDDDRLMGIISAGVSNTTMAMHDPDQPAADQAIAQDFEQTIPMIYYNPAGYGHHTAVSNTSYQFQDVYYEAQEELAGIGSQFDDGDPISFLAA